MAYATGLTVVVALAGCGSGQGSGAGASPGGAATPAASPAWPTPSSVQSTSGTVDPVLARIPAAARPETIQGAIAFLQHYFASLNRAFRMADSWPLVGLSSESCEMCTALIQGVNENRAKGRLYQTDFLHIEDPHPAVFTSSKRTFLFGVTQTKVNVVNTLGRKVDVVAGGSADYLATLRYAGGWSITNIQKVR